jgi:hypothetical protein
LLTFATIPAYQLLKSPLDPKTVADVREVRVAFERAVELGPNVGSAEHVSSLCTVISSGNSAVVQIQIKNI